MEDYEQAVNDLYLDKDRSAAEELVREAVRHNDPKTFAYAHLVRKGPFECKELQECLEFLMTQEGFDEGETLRAYYELLKEGHVYVYSGDRGIDIAERPVPSLGKDALKAFVVGCVCPATSSQVLRYSTRGTSPSCFSLSSWVPWRTPT